MQPRKDFITIEHSEKGMYRLATKVCIKMLGDNPVNSKLTKKKGGGGVVLREQLDD